MHQPRIAVVSLLILPLGLIPGVAFHAGAAEPPMCQGKAATIVGSPGEALTGTAGDDVVVLDGAVSLDSLAGDDLVCTGTPPAAGSPVVQIDTGDGADSVELHQEASVSLGAGPDTLLTDATSYSIDTGDSDDDAEGSAPSHDSVISTAVSPGVVSTGVDGQPDDDDIAFKYNGTVILSGTPAGHIYGGATSGKHGVESDPALIVFSGTPTTWAIDSSAGSATVGGVTSTLKNFKAFDLSRAAWSRLTLTGGPAREVVDLGAAATLAEGPASIDLGAGGGEVDVSSQVPLSLKSSGSATLYVEDPSGRAQHTVDDDLAGHAYKVDGQARGRFSGVDRTILVEFGRFVVRGSNGVDRIRASGCSGSITGAGGNDRISVIRAVPHGEPCATTSGTAFTVHGGAGDDLIEGSFADDALYGDGGYDVVDGRPGDDLCRAEKETRCER